MSIKAKQRQRHRRTVYEVRLRNPAGQEYSRTFTTRKAAEAYEVEQRAQRARGTWVDPRRADVLFSEVARAWLEGSPSKRGSGLARDESIVRNHLLPAIGERKLGSLTPRDIQAMVTAWSPTAAPRTVRRQYGVLTAILNHAVASDLVGRTPARGVRLPNLAYKRVRYIIGAEELASLVEALGDDHGLMAYLGTVLGLRWGECAGLKVGRVDFLGRTITVAERIWKPACQAIGLPDLGFHDLRRANATELVHSGVDVKTAQTRLGHSDPRLTLAIYAQATTDADRAAADKLGDALMRPAHRRAQRLTGSGA